MDTNTKEQIRRKYYEDLRNGEVKLPQHDFTRAEVVSPPTPTTKQRLEIDAKKGGFVLHDETTAKDPAGTTKGALIESEDAEIEIASVSTDPHKFPVDEGRQTQGPGGALDTSMTRNPQPPQGPKTDVQPDPTEVVPGEDGESAEDKLDRENKLAANKAGPGLESTETESQTTDKSDDQVRKNAENDTSNNAAGDEPADARDSIPIPSDFRGLPWNDARSLAKNFSDDPITNKDRAFEVIEEELQRRQKIAAAS